MDKLILYIFITSVVLIIKMINSKEYDIELKINLLMIITNFIICILITNYNLV